MADRKPGETPDIERILREAKEAIRRLTKEPPPTAMPELWPGGPSVDTGDIRLARFRRLLKARKKGSAVA